MEVKKKEDIKIPIEWHIPEDLKRQYATNMVVQHTDEEFIISFFEVKQPIILGLPDEIKSTLEKFDSIRAECFSQIIVTPNRMKVFINTMQKNLEKFLSKVEGKEEN
jgi:hypothetical protein